MLIKTSADASERKKQEIVIDQQNCYARHCVLSKCKIYIVRVYLRHFCYVVTTTLDIFIAMLL